jgi:hypothetical protein
VGVRGPSSGCTGGVRAWWGGRGDTGVRVGGEDGWDQEVGVNISGAAGAIF